MFLKKRKEKVDEIFKRIQNKNLISRYLMLLLGCSLMAFAFDLFFAPNNIVYGGVSGVAIVLDEIAGLDKSTFVLIASIILLIISYFTLGFEKTKGSIVGSIMYPVMMKILEPFTSMIDLDTNNMLLIVLFGALITGFGSGINFKSGFSAGGSDILNQILAKYGKMSIGKAMIFTDGLIVLGSGFFLNSSYYAFENVMYAVIVLYIISIIADKVILGISQCKAFYIVTEHETDVKRFIMDHLSSGVTVLDGRGGYTGDHQKVIMCIIHTKDYFLAKEGILSIDPNAFFLVTDAYEVSGGVRRQIWI